MTFIGFQAGGARRQLSAEAAGAAYRRTEVLVTGWRMSPRAVFGAGVAFVDIDLSIRISYPKTGGDGGDRRSITVRIGSDSTVIADALMNPDNWEAMITNVREMTFTSAAFKAEETPHAVVYEMLARAEVEAAWPA